MLDNINHIILVSPGGSSNQASTVKSNVKQKYKTINVVEGPTKPFSGAVDL